MKLSISVLLATVLAGSSVFAQMSGAGGPPGLSPAITKLFGSNNSFTAKAEVDIKNQSQPVSLELNFSMLEGKTRTEVDISQFKGGQMPPEAAARMKQMGMDKIVNITEPDAKTSLMIYPSLRAFAPITLGAPEEDKNPKIEKTKVGTETIDGHACVKNKVVITDNKGKQQEVLVWNATDLNDFPIQMQMTEGGNTVVVSFKDIKLGKPDAKLFQAPADYTKYGSMQELMQTEVMKRIGGAAGGQK